MLFGFAFFPVLFCVSVALEVNNILFVFWLCRLLYSTVSVYSRRICIFAVYIFFVCGRISFSTPSILLYTRFSETVNVTVRIKWFFSVVLHGFIKPSLHLFRVVCFAQFVVAPLELYLTIKANIIYGKREEKVKEPADPYFTASLVGI